MALSGRYGEVLVILQDFYTVRKTEYRRQVGVCVSTSAVSTVWSVFENNSRQTTHQPIGTAGFKTEPITVLISGL